MSTLPTIRVLVPLDRLAGVLEVIATEVPLDDETTVKVQDPTRHPEKHDLPVRGFRSRSAPERWGIVGGLALGAVVGLAVVLASPTLRGGLTLLIVGAAMMVGGLVGAVIAARSASEPVLELGDPDRVRVVRIRGLQRHQEGVQRLRDAGLALISGRGDDTLLADVPPDPTMQDPSLQDPGVPESGRTER
jgi:hypothetical protein